MLYVFTIYKYDVSTSTDTKILQLMFKKSIA